MRQETAALRDFSPVFVRYGSEADEATLSGYVRFTPKSAQRAMRLACPLCADCVAKVFLAFGRETLIQDRTRTSNNDSKEPTLRFVCYKFLFHRACLATFATQSTQSGHRRPVFAAMHGPEPALRSAILGPRSLALG